MKDHLLVDLNHPVVRDHTVYGRHILPGLAYIDMLYQFFRGHGHEFAGLELRDLTMYRPLAVSENDPVTCELEARGDAAGELWRITVRQGGGNVDPERRMHYASAQMSRLKHNAFAETLDPGQMAAKAAMAMSFDEVYERCARRELVQTGFMRAEGRVYSSEAAILAEIRGGPEALADADRVMFHPGLMDAAAVCVGLALAGSASADDPGLPLPLSCGSFRATELIQRECLIRVRRDLIRWKRDVCYTSIEFFSPSGRKVAELKDLASRMVRDPGLIDPQRAQHALPAPDLPPGHNRSGAVRKEIEALLLQLLSQRIGRTAHAIDPHASYYEMGLDSATLLELVQAIGNRLGRNLAPTVVFEYSTIAELASHLAETDGAPDPIGGDLPGTARSGTPRLDRVAPPDGNRGRDIAVIALAGRFPGARDVEQFWENLQAGKDCIGEVPHKRWNPGCEFRAENGDPRPAPNAFGGFVEGVEDFDPLFFNIAPRTAALIDPQVRLFLETVWNLLEGAGYTRKRLRDAYQNSVGVYVGSMYQLYGALDGESSGAAMRLVSSYAAIANRVSYWFGFRGPSLAIDTMCSSSLVALHTACKDLLAGECRMAIAGGVNLSLHPLKYAALEEMQFLASRPDRRSFADGDGFIPAEAVGAILLKPLASAVSDGDDILAVIKGTATNHSGRSNGFAVPNLEAQRQLIERVLHTAGAEARTISYVEAAATGAALSDAVELTALQQVFGRADAQPQFCAIGSVKSNIGHAEAASGITQLIKVVLQLRHTKLAPSIKAEPPNPHIALDDSAFHLQRAAAPWMRPTVLSDGAAQEYPRRALINSFGAGGSYASAVVEEYAAASRQPAPGREPEADAHVMTFSARNTDRLEAVIRQVLDYLRNHAEAPLADLAYTLQCGRESMESRLAVVVRDRGELFRSLEAYLTGGGGGSQLRSMRMFLQESATSLNSIDELVSGPAGDAIVRLLLDPPDLSKLAWLWVHGVDIPWEKLHRLKSVAIVPLPTYPFERQRCWINGESAARSRTREEPDGGSSPEACEGSLCDSPECNEMRDGLSARPAKAAFEPPRTELERTIADAWGEVLGAANIGVQDRFLDLGGSSFTGVRIIARLRELFGVEVPVAAFLEPHTTVETISVAVVSALAQQHEIA